MKYDVLTSGYVSMDRIIKIDRPAKVGFTSIVTNNNNPKINYGGCSVNIAYNMCKLGKRAMPVIRVGGDWENIGFKAFLDDGNVPIDALAVLPDETTSCCYLVQDTQGQHITLFYPGSMDAKYCRPLDDKYFKESKIGVITVASKDDNIEFFNRCKKNNLPIAFGMKSDFDAFPKEFLWDLLLGSKIIFTNETERKTLEDLFSLDSICDLFEKGEAEIIITTYGKQGSTYYMRNGDTKCVPICDCTKVIDTTGSGDAYIAGFLYGYLEEKSIEECCMLGSVLSSFVIEKEGCCTNAPDLKMLDERFSKFKACVR